MKIGLAIRGMLLTTTAVAAAIASSVAAAAAGDTDALLVLLTSKGVISSSEARSITSAPSAEQGDRLVAILRKKGVLADGDVKALKSRSQPVSVTATDARLAPTSVAPPPAAPVAPAPMPRKAAVFEVGGFEIAPVGYIALTGVSRNTNTGNATTTNFGAIPFDNTVVGNNTETRMSAQNTLLGLRAHGNIRGVDLTGYFEGDFNGNEPANVFVNSNSHTFRMRLAYADVKAGQFETSFGQTYSWLTPNRYGMGPDPADIFLTNNIDQSFQVGLPWARQAAAHLAWHPTQNFTIGAGVENPQQFTNNEVTFPAALNAQLQPQFDNGANPGIGNRTPDVVAKAAYDSDVWSGTRLHLEAAGMWRHFRSTSLPQGVVDSRFGWHDADGWATTVAGSLEFFKTFSLVGNAFWSDGGGRYLGALGPDVVALPTALAGGGHDITLSTVRSHGFLGGFEWRVLNPTVLSAYYGQAYFDNNYALDTTSTQSVKPFIGFGFPSAPPFIAGSATTNNKEIEQWTLDLKHTFWADPQYGAISGLAQYSYLRRTPWFVAAGAPPEAHTHLFFTELRYQLPGN
jgi:hypothetical protein